MRAIRKRKPVIATHVIHGDATHLPLPDMSIDAIITDPPYGLEFMGKDWDAPWRSGDGFRRRRNSADADRPNPFGRASRTSPEYIAGVGFQQWCETWATEAFRVLKPGGHIFAFGGTRTSHRLTCAIEDAGFEIRDSIIWIYGSGFPKSLDVSKAIDKAAGAKRKVIGVRIYPTQPNGRSNLKQGYLVGETHGTEVGNVITTPATDAARQWDGWGTALKPAHEPIVVARKPLVGTVAANVLRHGTGALNIDACRVQGIKDVPASPRRAPQGVTYGELNNDPGTGGDWDPTVGRWPSNVVFSHSPDCKQEGECTEDCPVAEVDRQSGISSGRAAKAALDGSGSGSGRPASGVPFVGGIAAIGYTDHGGASRFFPTFRYQAKAPAKERPTAPDGTKHSTVKPLELMRHLVRLVTPPGGTILDMFAGSGTTGEAAALEGFNCILIEKEDSYLPMIQQRIARSRKGIA